MSKHEIITKSPLVYDGIAIREKGEMLSLTDMWKAAGADASRAPAEWMRSADAERFVSFVADTLNMGISHDEVVKTVRGGRAPGTWAHWQVAMAYAKYLSPDFHMWCNEVVRAHMEGEKVPSVPTDTLEQIERSFGIMRRLSKKVTHIEKALPAIVEAMAAQAVTARMAESNMLIRHGVTAKEVWDRHNLPRGLRSSTNWLGNRLKEMGCMVAKADRGNGNIRIFDSDLAEACMKNGLLHKARVYSSERMGQGKFRLIGGVK